MISLNFTRRAILASSVPLSVYLSSCNLDRKSKQGIASYLLDNVGEIPNPRQADRIGNISAPSIRILEEFSNFIMEKLEFEKSVYEGMPFNIEKFISLKTTAEPSYLTEYEDFLKTLELLREETGSQKQAFEFMFVHDVPLKANNNPKKQPTSQNRITHHRFFVLWELANFLVLSGGFKKWGYENYTGYRGGPFNDQKNPPYRSYQ